MDGPQQYQPLSYALHPPASTSARPPSNHYLPTTTTVNNQHPQHSTYPQPHKSMHAAEEEEEEDEEDDDEEGIVEAQLNRTNDTDMHGSNPSSPRPPSTTALQQPSNTRPQENHPSPTPEKRRPGRPRGSKNRRPRIGSSGKHETQFFFNQPQTGPTAAPPTAAAASSAPQTTQAATTAGTPQQATVSTAAAAPVTTSTSAPPEHPNISSHNQQYYEFQWRVLNLCSEFYGAAEELVKGTSPLVVAQCYHMGPGVKIDPLVMLSEAKRICDNLLANPSQLVMNPPPSIYPALPSPSYHPTVPAPQVTPVASTSTAASTSTTTASTTTAPTTTISTLNPTTNVITNARSFVVPLNAQPASTYSSYPAMFGAANAYPTSSYYQYAGYHPPGAYYTSPTVPVQPGVPVAATNTVSATPAPVPGSSMSTVHPQPTATITTTPATGGTLIGNQGAWSEEETERLKKLTEESRSKGTTGEIEWDWVIQEWGISRTRHQILIKATNMGLKESTTRAPKRRRENEPEQPVMASLQPPQQQSTVTSNASQQQNNSMSLTSISSPSHSQHGSTPSASPALQHQPRPTSSKGPSSLSTTTSATTTPQQHPAVVPLPQAANPAHKLAHWPLPPLQFDTRVIDTEYRANQQQQQRQQQLEQQSKYYRTRPGDNTQQQQQPQKTAGTVQQMALPFTMYAAAPQNGQGMRPKENGK